MSEKAPRTNQRLENFEANKVAHETEQFEQALYGDAGATDFSDEARRRIEEADAYEQHLETLSERKDSNEVDTEYKDSIDRAIDNDPALRRMVALADQIRTIGATEISSDNEKQLTRMLEDKEEKLQELLLGYSETGVSAVESKEDIIDRIIDRTSSAPSAHIEVEQQDDEEATEVEVTTSDLAESDEDQAALEGESMEEYEARHENKSRFDSTGLDIEDSESAPKASRFDATGLDIEDESVASDETQDDVESDTVARSRRQRIRDALTPAGAASELNTLRFTTSERLKKHRRVAIALGALAAAGTIATMYFLKNQGHDISGPSKGIGGGVDLNPVPTPDSGQGPWSGETSNGWSYSDGSGGEALLRNNDIDPAIWYQHQDEFLKQFPDLAYRMSDGNVGLLDQGNGASSKLSNAAQAFWEQYK